MKTIDIERLTSGEPVFSFVLAGEGIDPAAVAGGAISLFDGELVGVSARVNQPGRSVKVTVMHDADYRPEDAFLRVKHHAWERGLAYAILPGSAGVPDFEVALFDMDSTLINQEVIEELAAFAGHREQVAEVTRLAMEGKLDFHQALRERVKLLAGQPASILEEVLNHHITPTPGLEDMVSGLHAAGIRVAVVSGGFIDVVGPFARAHGIDHAVANRLEVANGRLTGEVLGEIVDADVKRRTLEELCKEWRCTPANAIAMGDGANDLKMMKIAGLGVAFCAKPIVQEQALAAINRRRLDDLLGFLA